MGKKKTFQVEKVVTWEERKKRELDDLMKIDYLIPDPTYKFNIGDRVMIGNLEDVYISDVLVSGKIYEIDFTSIDNNYGNPIRNEHKKMLVKWIDIREYQEKNNDTLEKNADIVLNYSNRHMGDLFSKAYYFGVNFEPEYQRDYVWDFKDKVALIDSIFNNVDIGKFVFIHKGYSEDYMYEILDGKQRMRAILDFYEDRFRYKGRYFSDLSYKDKNHFKNYGISIAEVNQLTEEQVLRYFLMVNTTGKSMAKEHLDKIRNMLKRFEKDAIDEYDEMYCEKCGGTACMC